MYKIVFMCLLNSIFIGCMSKESKKTKVGLKSVNGVTYDRNGDTFSEKKSSFNHENKMNSGIINVKDEKELLKTLDSLKKNNKSRDHK